ncbi:hypothetical protein RchiOBHm_Chr5g0077471 [Rosa chinensis]|uniref:Uncharacterized protein n=1 Tax=Rosa chinensis TaxID=74649 RepID=A0A2P6QM22_ROSCH|nr:hypothetical protein RchiOBHm_Chr5g0077471 [Rosa chinensis]
MEPSFCQIPNFHTTFAYDTYHHLISYTCTNRGIQQFSTEAYIKNHTLTTLSVLLFSQQNLSPQTKSSLTLFYFLVRTN